MIACPTCGTGNPDAARFCLGCGGRLLPVDLVSPSPVRKRVTILFIDVVGSTELGERLDPEVVRGVMAGYFSMMQRVIEAHGGTVEKFIGDAVMAVFGVPLVHEDDALRAVRAALEIATQVDGIGASAPAGHAPVVRFRTGINTGEVVTGGAGATMTLATGDAVNTAARLEQAAGPGEILIGHATWVLVRDAVTIEAVGPISAKGKSERVPAYRLTGVVPDAAGRSRRSDGPLVGRERELALLLASFGQVMGDAQPRLVTVLGTAGVGKSRLVAELIGSLGDSAMVYRGRCPSYGTGATWSPLREVVLAASGIDDTDDTETSLAKLERLCAGDREGPEIAVRLATAVGLLSAAVPLEEIAWAARRLLEHLARDRAVVVVFDDIHWAESAFLDLIDSLVATMRGARLLLVCPTRPELLERRPGWLDETSGRTTIELDPLDAKAAERLIDSLPGGSLLPRPIRERILTAAEGNPLFVEEMLGMLIDGGRLRHVDGAWQADADLDDSTVPPTIRALLAARIDGLAPLERAVAERASVVGRVFERAAVSAVSSDTLRPRLGDGLAGLLDRRLIGFGDDAGQADESYRFRHVLIRDAAYERLSLADRADLHERLADWLEATIGDRTGEHEETIGFHLEQACVYLTALGMADTSVEALADRAVERLGSAGSRAERQSDADAAIGLFLRARGLLQPDDPRRVRLGLHLAYTCGRAGRTDDARAFLAEAVELSGRLDDAVIGATARLVELDFEETLDPERWLERVVDETDRLEPVLEAAGDHDGLAQLWQQRLFVAVRDGRLTDAETATRTALTHARASGDPWMLGPRMTGNLGALALDGPMTVVDGLRLCGSLLASMTGDRVRIALMHGVIACLEAMHGDGGAAVARLDQAQAVFDEVGRPRSRSEFDDNAGLVRLLLGDPDGAERSWRTAYDRVRGLDDVGFIPTLAARLARALVELDRVDEALDLVHISAEVSAGTDVVAEILWRGVRARALAWRGDPEAVSIAAEGVAIARSTEYLHLTADAYLDLAMVQRAAGREREADEAASEALSLFEAKGDVVSARRITAFLEAK